VDGTARIWDVVSGLNVREMGGHPRGAMGISVSPDGRFAAVGTGEQYVKIWELATAKEVRHFAGKPSATWHVVAYSPDGKSVAFGGSDGAINLGDTTTGTVRVLGTCPKAVRDLAWSPDGRWIASASEDPSLRLWEPASGAVTGFPLPDAGYFSVAFSPKGDLLAAGGYDWTLRLWELPPAGK
jgi:WD40 repeat protein